MTPAPTALPCRLRRSSSLLLLLSVVSACREAGPSERAPAPPARQPTPSAAATAAADRGEAAARACALEWSSLADQKVGAPTLDAARAQLLGRARGEPVYFVRAPTSSAPSGIKPRPEAAVVRVSRLAGRYAANPAALRAEVLREGYLLSEDPGEAVALTQVMTLSKLFTEPVLHLQRGVETRRLERRDRPARYVWAEGPDAGEEAGLLLGDRVAIRVEELADPIHRDVGALADEVGFDRARVRGGGPSALALDVRVSGSWRRAVARSAGAKLTLGCWTEPDAEALAAKARAEPRHVALAKLRGAVSALVREGLRFDRPQGVKTADRDGELRPSWWQAYKRGGRSFSVDGEGYTAFDPSGNPHPPEVCVDFVLDSFERGSGTWFEPLGKAPGRRVGTLDWEPLGGRGLRGVLALFDWAAKRPDLFQTVRFPDTRRVPFGQRGRFLGGLVDDDARARDPALAGPRERLDVEAGDIVAIHGEKSDGLIHQHAILVERVDPLTGLPSGLADQMKKPRRRTWEGIMAEAPKRSLLYRIRPTDELWRRLGG